MQFMITPNDISTAIEELRLSGKTICIHAGMRSFGTKISGGAEMIVNTFLNKHCTILVPTFSYHFQARPVPPYMPEQNGAGDYSYWLSEDQADPDTVFSANSKELTAEEMGVLSKHILESGNSFRGNHPLNSFTAIGPNAYDLIKDQTSSDVYAPFRKLIEKNGEILLMGTDLRSATIIHYAEQIAGRKLFIRWAFDENKKVIPVRTGGCSDGFSNFENILKKIATQTIVGKSVWQCFNAKEMVELCAAEIRKNAAITHCADIHCERCHDAILGGPDSSW